MQEFAPSRVELVLGYANQKLPSMSDHLTKTLLLLRTCRQEMLQVYSVFRSLFSLYVIFEM